MSKLYKQTTLLVSRCYYHGGEGLENLGLRFFRSMEEYEDMAKKKGWNCDQGRSSQSSWCTEPIEIRALVAPKDLAGFKLSSQLSADKVFFAGTLATSVHQVGGLQS